MRWGSPVSKVPDWDSSGLWSSAFASRCQPRLLDRGGRSTEHNRGYELWLRLFERPAEAVVFKPKFRHGCRIKKVAAIDDEGPAHRTIKTFPVELAELRPLGEDQ